MIHGPCKDCRDRHPLCHSDCAKYLDYRKQIDAYKRYRELNSVMGSVNRRIKDRTIKKR